MENPDKKLREIAEAVKVAISEFVGMEPANAQTIMRVTETLEGIMQRANDTLSSLNVVVTVDPDHPDKLLCTPTNETSRKLMVMAGMCAGVSLYSVLVGNVGEAYSGYDAAVAFSTYDIYVNLSKLEHGRASGEPVVLLRNGEPEKEYEPPLHEEGSD